MRFSQALPLLGLLTLALSVSNCRRRGGDIASPASDNRVGLDPSTNGDADALGANSARNGADGQDGLDGKDGENGGDGVGGSSMNQEDGQDGSDGKDGEDSIDGEDSTDGDETVDDDEKEEDDEDTVGDGDAKVEVLDIKFGGKNLYKGSDVRMDKAIIDADDGSDIEKALKYIYSVPVAVWIDGSNADPSAAVESVSKAAAEQDRMLAMVIHAVPKRHCSAGGGEVANAQEYEAWIDGFIKGVGNRPAVVILEPNALGKADNCANTDSSYSLQEMLDNIKMAVGKLTAVPTLDVYIEMGFWVESSRIADLVDIVDPDQGLKGMVVNNSDYRLNAEMNTVCENANAAFNGSRTLPCIIDTGRNSQPTVADMEWCNAPGRGLGMLPADISSGLLKGYLWIRNPADSDGECGRGEPEAGKIFPERSVELYEKRYQ